MNADEFKKEIDSIFPCRWGDDFLRDFQKLFAINPNKLSCVLLSDITYVKERY